MFQSTRPVRGATVREQDLSDIPLVSIHAPRAGRDAGNRRCRLCTEVFQSTRPVRGATLPYTIPPSLHRVSIHAPRAGCDDGRTNYLHARRVSIHAPRAGRDIVTPPLHPHPEGFNPRAPCGARPRWRGCGSTLTEFQSTRPVRGATGLLSFALLPAYVSIHAPRAGRDCDQYADTITFFLVSIHAPRAGRDRAQDSRHLRRVRFNPRAPCGARPGADRYCLQARRSFNPRAPCGARRRAVLPHRRGNRVSIHAPRAGRDLPIWCAKMSQGVSIHAPRAGRDGAGAECPLRPPSFNPRAPCGARPSGMSVLSEIL